MQFKIPATALSIKSDSFKDDKGVDVNYSKIVMLVDGEVVEVNTKDEDVISFTTDNLQQEKTYILDFKKNQYGAYKIRLSL